MEIPEIKTRLNIETVLERYHLKADQHHQLPCPFHEESTPSFTVYPVTNTFHCFGCGKSGDTIEFIQIKERCTKHEAIVKAQDMIGIPTTRTNTPQKLIADIEPLSMEERITILKKIFEGFRGGLAHPVSIRAKDYLKSRHLNVDMLEMGYNSGQFHHHGKLSETHQRACLQVGLLIPYTGTVPNGKGTTYSPFARDCIIFPLKDKQNQIVSLYGRSIINHTNSKHYYLKNRMGLYPGYPKETTTHLILTEAIIDAATLQQDEEIASRYTILSCYGTNGLTEEHTRAIKGLNQLKEIIFFFDGDTAGKEGITKHRNTLHALCPKVMISYVDTPQNEDINSLLQGHEPQILHHLIENRNPLFVLSELSEAVSRGQGVTLVTNENSENTEASASKETAPESKQEPPLTNPFIGKLNVANPEYITFETDTLQMALLGGISLSQIDRLRTTLKIRRKDSCDPLHAVRHTLDLYHSDYLERFIARTSEQLEIGGSTLKRALSDLIEQVESYRIGKLEGMKNEKPAIRVLSEEARRKAIGYLQSPRLMERTNEDISKTGLIGEQTNRLLMYLVFTSRLREQPLHIVSLGESGSGKTYLQEKVSELIPEENKVEITILSENAFYYFDRQELTHKLVLIEDMDGAQEVLYPLRELQTKAKISKTVPLKDSKGNLRTITLHVEGPICLAGTTTRERLYEDNANRSLLIYLDGSAEHKEQIMEYQRALSAGSINKQKETDQKAFFKDMQSVLKPVKVRNPFAQHLRLPQFVFKPLRTNAHYLAFIETITFYHQYQRPLKVDPSTGEQYIETTLEDIQWANLLLKDVLLAKSDELSGECRSFFEKLKAWVKTGQKTSFFVGEVREAFRMNPSNLKYYLVQLTRYGYIKSVGGNRYKRGYEYEIVNFKEYHTLNASIENVFDQILCNIKNKVSG